MNFVSMFSLRLYCFVELINWGWVLRSVSAQSLWTWRAPAPTPAVRPVWHAAGVRVCNLNPRQIIYDVCWQAIHPPIDDYVACVRTQLLKSWNLLGYVRYLKYLVLKAAMLILLVKNSEMFERYPFETEVANKQNRFCKKLTMMNSRMFITFIAILCMLLFYS